MNLFALKPTRGYSRWWAALLCVSALTAAATPPAATKPDDSDAASRVRGDPFYTTRCAMCDKERYRTGKSIAAVYDSRECRFCSEDCQDKFEADQQAHITALDARLIADQTPLYPLRTSIVSRRELPDKPVDVIWNNRLFRLADESERASLLEDPGNCLRTLDSAVIEAQTAGYGPTKCPVQGDFFEPEMIVEIVIGNRMIRLCCTECVRVVRKNPGQYLKMVDSANRQAAEKRRQAESRPQ